MPRVCFCSGKRRQHGKLYGKIIWCQRYIFSYDIGKLIKHITDLAGEETCIKELQSQDAIVDIYNAQGTMVKANTNINKAMKTLPRGIYIIKGLKIAIN